MNIPLNIDWQQILLPSVQLLHSGGRTVPAAVQAGKELHGQARQALCRHGVRRRGAGEEHRRAGGIHAAAVQAALDAELDEKRAAAAREAEAYAHQQRTAAYEQADKIVAAAARTRRTTARRSWTRPIARPCPSPRPPWRSCWRRRLPAPMTRS